MKTVCLNMGAAARCYLHTQADSCSKMYPKLWTAALNTNQLMKCLVKQTQLHTFCRLLSALLRAAQTFVKKLSVSLVDSPARSSNPSRGTTSCHMLSSLAASFNCGEIWPAVLLSMREGEATWTPPKRDNMQLKEGIKSSFVCSQAKYD